MRTRHPIPHSLTRCTSIEQWRARRSILRKQLSEVRRRWRQIEKESISIEKRIAATEHRIFECERKIESGDKTPCP